MQSDAKRERYHAKNEAHKIVRDAKKAAAIRAATDQNSLAVATSAAITQPLNAAVCAATDGTVGCVKKDPNAEVKLLKKK